MDHPRATVELVGRHAERAALAAFVDDLGPWPAGLVLVGEAGAGKTTLWRDAVVRARALGYRVLMARPAEAEAQFAFAGLRDLLDGAFDEVVDALPAPQARALEVALLRREPVESATARTTISAGLLTALRHMAERQPVVVALDDAQWLDAPSAATLTFALRRCTTEQIAVVGTRRAAVAGGPDLRGVFGGAGVRELPVGPMARTDVEELVRNRMSRPLGRSLVRRVSAAAAGNPFFAMEMAYLFATHSEAAAGGLLLPAEVSGLLAERLGALSPGTRLVLGAAALCADATVPVLVGAAAPADARELLREAEAAELISLAPVPGDPVTGERRVRFLHPLLAAAIEATLTEPERAELHQRLAHVALTQDERARHLAAATSVPDELVAETLEAAALGARQRGAPEIGAQLALAADRLTPLTDPTGGQRRTLLAGDLCFAAGEPDQARSLLERASRGFSSALAAEASVRLGRVLMFTGELEPAVNCFEEVLGSGPVPPEVAAEGHEGAAWSYLLRWQDIRSAHRHAAAGVAAADRAGSLSLRSQALATWGATGLLLGSPGAAKATSRSLDNSTHLELTRVMQHPEFPRAVGLAWSDRHDDAAAAFTALAARASDLGDEVSRPRLLFGLSYVALQQGRWREARELAGEAKQSARLADQQPRFGLLLFSAAVVDAHLGNPPGAESDSSELSAMIDRVARGTAALGNDDPATADEQLGPLVAQLEAAGVREPGALRPAADQIEALVRLDRLDAAAALLDRHRRRARATRRPVAVASALRVQALLHAARGEMDASLSAAEQALATGVKPLPPFERARALLVAGTVARRAKQKRVARQHLEEAERIFASLGALSWRQRAADDLARIGGRTTSRGLTVTELRVAHLVADGMSNREVAAALFVTEKTVEATLSRVFTKLAIHSRSGLARRLEAAAAAGGGR